MYENGKKSNGVDPASFVRKRLLNEVVLTCCGWQDGMEDKCLACPLE